MAEKKEINIHNLKSKQYREVFAEVELTQHAMRLSTSALAEDWEDEDDTYWEAFLDY